MKPVARTAERTVARTITHSAAALSAALAFSLLAGCASTTSMAEAPRARVVIQVSDNDPAKWNLALNVAANVQKDLGADKSDVEIVAFGPGLGMLKADAVVANRVIDAIGKKVQVAACGNTMAKTNVSKDDLTKDVVVVPAGAIEIMKRQGEGWAYLRP